MFIYKISSAQSDYCYIGSTSYKYLSQRFASHRCHYKNYKNNKSKFYTVCKLFDSVGGVKNCKIELLEYIIDREQLYTRERYHILNNNCVNKNIPRM